MDVYAHEQYKDVLNCRVVVGIAALGSTGRICNAKRHSALNIVVIEEIASNNTDDEDNQDGGNLALSQPCSTGNYSATSTSSSSSSRLIVA